MTPLEGRLMTEVNTQGKLIAASDGSLLTKTKQTIGAHAYIHPHNS